MLDLHLGSAVKRVGIEHVLIVSDEQVCEKRNVCVLGKKRRWRGLKRVKIEVSMNDPLSNKMETKLGRSSNSKRFRCFL